MPLSEEELRLLEQMERALSAEDPKFASTLRGTSLQRSARRRAVLAGVALVAGMAVLVVGVVTKLWVLGVLGFVVMVAAGTWGLGALHSQKVAAGTTEATGPRPARGGFGVVDGGRSRGGRGGKGRQRSSGTFMQRLEARWIRRRQEGGGF